MWPLPRVVAWLRTADGLLPRTVRSARREGARRMAKRRHGSITAHMDAIVAEANRATTGSGFPDRHRPRAKGPASRP